MFSRKGEVSLWKDVPILGRSTRQIPEFYAPKFFRFGAYFFFEMAPFQKTFGAMFFGTICEIFFVPMLSFG